jgi:glycerate kinase
VLAAAATARVPAAVVAGSIAAELPEGSWRGTSLTGLAGSTAAASGDPARWLRLAGQLLATEWGRDPAGGGMRT